MTGSSDGRVIVFDLDGTLVDSMRDLIPALNAATATAGLPAVPKEQVGHVVGQGARRMIERAFNLHRQPLDQQLHDALFDRFLVHYEQNIANETIVFPGFDDAASELLAGGWRLAVCTNKFERLSKKLLDALSMTDLFDFIAGADTFEVRKPHPGHIVKTVEAAGGDPARSIMVGDSINDIAAAKSVPMPVIAVDFGYSDVPVATLAPDAVISHFSELVAAVEKLAR